MILRNWLKGCMKPKSIKIMNKLQEAAKTFCAEVMEYYKDHDPDDLTQVFMRGYFTGWTEHNVYDLAEDLMKNQKDFPIKMDDWPLKDPAPEKQKSFFSRGIHRPEPM